MTDYVEKYGLKIYAVQYSFVKDRALDGTGLALDVFWKGLSDLITDLAPVNRMILDKRSHIQAKIDAWHVAHRDAPHDHNAYKAFLRDIGYLVEDNGAFQIETNNIDPEIASIPGPQLVVPITNARYALNAANGRWGSLYDCLYGTDAVGAPPPKGEYNKGHLAKVVGPARVFLDSTVPSDAISHAVARRFLLRMVNF